MKNKTVVDSAALHYANLAIFAERDGDYEKASEQWHRAAEASLKLDTMLLYRQASERCERRARESVNRPDKELV
jgi:hypothetical protein